MRFLYKPEQVRGITRCAECPNLEVSRKGSWCKLTNCGLPVSTSVFSEVADWCELPDKAPITGTTAYRQTLEILETWQDGRSGITLMEALNKIRKLGEEL